jgi:hypothetical protein
MAEFTQMKSDQFLEETRHALQGMRRALIELYGAIGADPTAPQDVARRFSMNRNLTWKLSRVINASDPFATLNHLPGAQGLELAVGAFEKAGAPPSAVSNVRDAIRRLHDVVDSHAGDRDHLELTLESMGLFERETRPDSGRELAFRGNSMIWGVQARTRASTVYIAPGATPDKVDYVMTGGLVGFRRLRDSARWRLFRLAAYNDRGNQLLDQQVPEAIETSSKRSDVPSLMLPEFCSPNMPGIESFTGADGREFILPAGPVGNQAAFDCFYGYIARGLPAYRDAENEWGSTASPITLPVETMLLDIIYHKDAAIPDQPEILVYGFPHGGPDNPSAQTVQNLLPITERAVELAGSPPALATPLAPQLARMAQRVYTRMGWNPSDFRGLRIQIKYPPMSSRVVVRWPLPPAP